MTDFSHLAASSNQPAEEPPLPPVQAEFQPLDPRVLKIWRISHLIGSAVLLGAGAIAVVMAGMAFGMWILFWAMWGGIALLRAGLFIWYLPKAYRAWGYRIDGRVLETRHGVWFRVLELLPLSRLQHVDLHSGPIERHFGVASLVLHTAGTHQASITIPGLESGTAVRLRDQLAAIGGDDGV